MTKPRHPQMEKIFTELILPFYHLKRTTRIPTKGRRWENDAEHSWSLALLACAIAPEIDPELQVGKVCQFAVVHDLVEVYAGDTSMFVDVRHDLTKEEREAQALQRLQTEFSYLPWLTATIEEYECKESNEAKFVYAMDKYIAIMIDYLDKGRQFREWKVTLDDFNKKMEAHHQKAASHAGALKYYEEVRTLLNQRPEYFHIEG